MSNICVIITDEAPFGGLVKMAKKSGADVKAVVVGSSELASKVASCGVSEVLFCETTLSEQYAKVVANEIKTFAPNAVFCANALGAKVLAGAVASALNAVIIPGVTEVKFDNDEIVLEQSALSGRVLDTLATKENVVGFFGGADEQIECNSSVEIKQISGDGYAMEAKVTSSGSSAGITEADRVVSVGRGLKSKDDLPMVEALANAMNAKIGCSMPVADDLGWISKDQYVGRSGQHISPRIYLTLGISGAPQHLEGVRGAKIIAAINNDPEARIFRAADYGIVGDIYEIVPALTNALK